MSELINGLPSNIAQLAYSQVGEIKQCIEDPETYPCPKHWIVSSERSEKNDDVLCVTIGIRDFLGKERTVSVEVWDNFQPQEAFAYRIGQSENCD